MWCGQEKSFVAPSPQRATWPPRAAVRQFSMALITLSWSRLTWPRLASRHVVPWPRKMSATSRLGRTTQAGLRRPSGYFLWDERREPVQRAHDLANEVGGHLGVARRRVELGMPEQDTTARYTQVATNLI